MTERPTAGTPLRVLLAEDDPDDAVAIERQLRRGPDPFLVTLTRVASARDLAAVLEAEQWDVVISDFRMDAFDGRQALAIVRARNRDIPFLMVSGTVGEDVAVEMVRLGADDYLMKDRLARLQGATRRALRDAAERAGRREAEEALAASERTFRAVLEASPSPILVVEREGRVAFANRRTEEVFGFLPDEVLGGSIERLLPGVLRDFDLYHVPVPVEGPAGSRPPVGLRMAARRRDGSGFPVEVSHGVIESGDSARVMVTIVDRTAQDLLEAELRQAQKMEAIGQFAAGMAHDFRNLMHAIGLQSGLLEADLPPDDRRHADFAEIHRAIERGTALVRSVLEFARPAAGQPRAVEVGPFLHGLEPSIRQVAGPGIQVVVAPAPDAGTAWVDPNLLSQVILNLAMNACDAMPAGGRLELTAGLLEVSPVEAAIYPDFAAGRYVRFRVADTGMGMDEATLARIYEPFFTTKEAGKGTGLGLPMAFMIVRRARGRIEVRSAPGAGTTFHLDIPAPRPSTANVGRRERRRT